MPNPISKRHIHLGYTWNHLSLRVLKSELLCLVGPIGRECDGFTITSSVYDYRLH